MALLCPRGHPSDTTDFCDECGLPMTPGPTPAGVSEVASLTFNERIAASSTAGETGGGAPGGPPGGAASADDEFCPLCGTPRSGRFCEEDGHDFALAGAPAGPGVVTSGSASGSPVPPSPQPPSPQPPSPQPQPPQPQPPRPPALETLPPTPREAALAATGWTVSVEADRAYFDAVVARQGPDIDTVAFPTYYPRQVVVLSGAEMRIGRRRVTGGAAEPDVDLSGPPLDPGVSHLHAVLLPDGDGGWSLLDPGSTNGTTVNGAEQTIPVDTLVPLRPGDRIHVGAYTTLVVARADG